MKLLEQFSDQQKSAVEQITQLFKKHGAEIYLVGGCVRDSLLGIAPKDIDIEIICPHTLGNRSVIFDSKTPIEVLFDDLPAEPLVSIDGKKYFKKKSLSSISIQLAKERFPLIHNQANTHFSIVRDKLNWGDPTVR